jgi:hypothetical protein
VFTDGDGDPVHPHALHQAFGRIVANAEVAPLRFHDLRHTHGSLLLREGIAVKVVSERLGHAHIAHTIHTYQHLLPGMQADAARTYQRLAGPVPTDEPRLGGTSWEQPEEHRLSRRNVRTTSEAQVADLGLHSFVGGGCRI